MINRQMKLVFVIFMFVLMTNTIFAKTTINFNPEAKISNIKYSIAGNSKEYDAKTIDNYESYFIDYKDKTKTVQVYLSGFNKNQPVFAIVTTPEKLNDIDTELKSILDGFDNFSLSNTDNFLNKIKDYAKIYSFKKYITQTKTYIVNNSFKTDYWDSINFNFGKLNEFKFTIEKGTENDKFVLIFMQISDLKEINIAYTNLYILDKKEQSIYNLCEINRKLTDFYCKGKDCDLPKNCLDRWDFDAVKFWREPVIEEEQPEIENVVETISYSFNGKCSILKQKTLDEYINCLKSNINILNINKTYYINTVDNGRTIQDSGTGTNLINNKYKDPSFCYGSEKFNNVVFSIAKKQNLSEEETAQLWSKLAAESGCSLTCGSLGCHGDGIGQVVYRVHVNNYSNLKKYLLEINSSKYSTESKYQKLLKGQDNDPESATEFSIAFNRANISSLILQSKSAAKPITNKMVTEYDNDDAIDATLITAYLYCSPNYSLFSKGISPIDETLGCPYTTLHKLGYYLAYKKMIYNCHNSGTTNSFVNAYKNTYGGKYCDKPKTTYSSTTSDIGSKILKQAEKYLGRPYKWEGRNGYTVKGIGTMKSDFDCVGLQYVVLRDLGYLDDSADCLQLFSGGCAFADYLENNKGHINGIVGNINNKSDLDLLKPGDLLALNTSSVGIFGHGAIYVGIESGKHKYINASGGKNIAGSVKYDYLEDKLNKGTLKYPFQYQRIINVNTSNIDCSKNYISVSKEFGGCCKYTTYC